MGIAKYTGGDKTFLAACEKANTPATRRQFAKWNQKRGKAHALARRRPEPPSESAILVMPSAAAGARTAPSSSIRCARVDRVCVCVCV